MQAVADPLQQLDQARAFALKDAALYASILPGVLPIIGPQAAIDLRRWGADFLAETFATPSLAEEEKQKLSLVALDLLKSYLEASAQDSAVIKSSVQAATNVYPLLFRHVIYNPRDAQAWQKLLAIKSKILRDMDNWPVGVRACCIKFIQRVVQVQTPGIIANSRQPDQNDVSLSLVLPDHPLITPQNLEAEASGLLDRLLSVFQDAVSDVTMITATLNCIGVLVRTRASISNKILNVILNFNPFRMAISPISPTIRVMTKSMERTTKAFLVNLNKRNPNHPLAARIQGHIDRLQQTRMEVLDDSRKRMAPTEPTDGLDSVKRQKLGAEIPEIPVHAQSIPTFPSLPPGPVSLAHLFTLTQNDAAKAFDAQMIPWPLLSRIIVPLLSSIDQTQLQTAVNAIRDRFLSKAKEQPPPTNGDTQTEDAERFMNQFDAALEQVAPVSLGPLVIPQPPPLTDDEVDEFGTATVRRVFSMINTLDDPSAAKVTKAGFNRLAASNYDRDSWVTVLARLATRTTTGLDTLPITKSESPSNPVRHSVSASIRDALHIYILEDFRKRIDVAISWLNEEWYNDALALRAHTTGPAPIQNYPSCARRLLDGLVTYLDARDKVLIRFLSEIPALDAALLSRVSRLARDPERVSLAVTALQYLILFRPPVREICLDALEEMWRDNENARAPCAKILGRWRPTVLEEKGNAMDTKVESEKVVV